jgi:hypothetical protein
MDINPRDFRKFYSLLHEHNNIFNFKDNDTNSQVVLPIASREARVAVPPRR